jgi:hypothetical protein
MAGSTISTTISQTVTIGSASYPSPLTITHAGLIDPSSLSTSTINFGFSTDTYAGFGITSTNSDPDLDNLGIILGATAASFTDVGQTIGGYGVFFKYGGTVMNAGTIKGGAGRYGKGAVGFIDFGTVINTGLLTGGYGSSGAGSGIETYFGGDVFNGYSGIIKGGSGPDGAGPGIILEGGTLTNDGTILGGDGGLGSGNGGVFPLSTTIINNNLIHGGNGGKYGGDGAIFDEEFNAHASAIIINSSLISGGYGSVSGGVGVGVASGSLLNIGVILGGSGLEAGGTGAEPGNFGEITNDGTILGGNGTLAGGNGIGPAYYLFGPITDATILNNGLISGGSGSISGNGIYLYDGSTVTNQGTIIGGGSLGNGILINKNKIIRSLGIAATNGVIINGAVTDTSALIFGNNGVEIQGTTTSSLINFASIVGRKDGIYIQQTVSAPSTVINEATGTITGANFGIHLKAAASISNTGLINNAGLITSAFGGIYEYGRGGIILNTGTITGSFDGIFIVGGADIVNGASNDTAALIATPGAGFGVYIGAPQPFTINSTPAPFTIASIGTVVNYGTIQSKSLEAVLLKAGTVINGTVLDNEALITGVKIAGNNGLEENFGTINGNGQVGNALYAGMFGVVLNGATNDTTALIETNAVQNINLQRHTTLTNYGSIIGGSNNGVYAQSGIISNASTGVIIGGKKGAYVAGYGAETIFNAGVIEGTIGIAAVAQYSYSDVFSNSGTIASLLGSVGTAIAFAKGNDLLIDDPTGVFIGTVSGGAGINTIELASGGRGVITGIGTQFTQFSNINFDTGASWSAEGNIAGLAQGETISGFTVGDTIILDGFAATSDTYTSDGLVLGDGSSYVTLDITGSFTTANFEVVDPPAETTITVVCYRRGTRIATPAGERAVEDLAIGDAVMTKFGGYRRIQWIGRQSYARRFIAGNFDQIPVKFAAGSLGPNLPKRELSVSPGHAMLVGGVLVLAKSLVNGITITQDDCPAQVDYFQLEFETHDCVLAEGVWSESYADTPGLRGKFHNAAEFHALYPGHVEPETQILCAPRPLEGPGLDAALRPLLARLPVRPGPLRGCIDEVSPGVIRGWAWDEANPHLPVLLEIAAGEKVIGTILACDYRDDLAKAGIGRGHCSFRFEKPAGLLRQGAVTIRRVQDGAEIRAAPEYEQKALRRAG